MIGSADGEPMHAHPQFALAGLLARIGIVRGAVTTLGGPAPHGRERLTSEALRPAAASELWRERLAKPDFAEHADAAMKDIAVIEAANAEEEALAIAVTLREAMETPGKTAALVTPDRLLARRVLAALQRWNVPVDDSGGDGLADTPAGVFARLAAAGGARRPRAGNVAGAAQASDVRPADGAAVSTLEQAVLRGPRPKPGTAGLADALDTFRNERDTLHGSDPRRFLTEPQLEAAAGLVAKLKAALAPLETLGRVAQPFSAIAERHLRVLLALGGITEDLAKAFDEIVEAGSLAIEPARLCRAVPRRHIRAEGAAAGADVPRPHLRRDRGAAAIGRPAGAGRPGRGRLAAGDPRRPLAQPADATHARPRPAGAPHWPLGARLRPGARCRRGDPISRGKAGRRADRRLALRAAARRGRGQGSLGRRRRTRRRICGDGAQARRRRNRQALATARAQTAARGAAPAAQRHRDRGLAARSLHHLCQARAEAAAARRHRHAARRGRPRYPDPRQHRRFRHELIPKRCRTIRSPRCARSASGVSTAGGFPGGQGVLVAALSAHRRLAGALRDRAAREAHAVRRRDRRQHPDSVRQASSSSSRCGPTASSISRMAASPCWTTRPARRRPTSRF